MKSLQKVYSVKRDWQVIKDEGIEPSSANFVLVFGSRELLSKEEMYPKLKEEYPNADILLNSTAGEIADIQVYDDSLSLVAIQFEKTKLKTASTTIVDTQDSFKAGYRLASEFDGDGLKSVFIISDGHIVNGSDLVMGLQEFLPKGTIITGGLAGDGSRFQTTLVGLNEQPTAGRIVAIGFYGKDITVGYGSVGGWDTFGVERLITKSKNNILYELDGKPALEIYKTYLGDYVKDLPGSALLFPLNVREKGSEYHVVRTILSVDENSKSLKFAGNIPEGSYAQLMRANFDRLVDGASNAAVNTLKFNTDNPDLAILISCVGRKLVLDPRIEEEVEVVRALYGAKTTITGFYSYGEISPTHNFMKCELHNQTMTITTFTEK